MSKNKNFEYLGSGFQLQLLNQLVVDKDFAKTIIDVIDVNYFENKYFKLILQMIKEYYSRYENVPNYDTLKQLTLSEIAQENAAKLVIDTIKKIQDAPMDGQEFVQEKALKFCKQQELQKVMVKAQKIIDGGEFENYDKVEQLVRDALQVGQHDNGLMNVFSNIDEVLEEDYRHPIPMGVSGIDRLLKGGLARGEIGVVLAPTGVGKEHGVSEPLLTPTGWTTMGEIDIGDKVIGSDGKEQYVLGKYPQGVKPIYKVEFTDNTFVNCGLEHLWTVKENDSKEFVVLTANNIMDGLNQGNVYQLPMVKPVEFQGQEVDEDPYEFGLSLYDGDVITEEITITQCSKYIYNTVNVRLNLLRGLFDTLATMDEQGYIICEINDGNKAVIRELVLSLGGIIEDMGDNFRITFTTGLIPFGTLNKIDEYLEVNKPIQQKYVKGITYSHDEEAVCIKVSNPDELYVSRDYVLTHNTTMLTKIANSAFNHGYNVLQIFFEDNEKIIQRKHYTLWTKIHPDDLTAKKEEVQRRVKEIESTMENKLILCKMPSDSVTISQIKNKIRKMIADGIKIDMVVLDYIDCVISDRQIENEWKAEGAVMRGFESMCHELDMAGWCGTQGGRNAISAEVVTTDQMGGSIKKAQVGHVILTIARTLPQKEMKLATMAITKSRIGDDGIVFENCKFDNGMLDIDTDTSTTFLGHEEKQEQRNKDRIRELMDKRKEKQKTE